MRETATGKLGALAEEIQFEDSDTLRELSREMAAQCRNTLDIASRQLDKTVYDDEEFVEAVRQLAIGSRYARIRILVNDVAALVGQGHRLVQLAERLPTFIAIRTPAVQHRRFNEALLIADNTGYIHRRFADRFAGQANFNDRGRAGELTGAFDELWNHAELDPNLRRLGI